MHLLARFAHGRPAGWAALALCTVVAGYVDLWFGGTDLASVLLTIGYLVFVPAALWMAWRPRLDPLVTSRGRASSTSAVVVQGSVPPYGAAALVALAILALYAVSLAPTTAMWDTSEYIAAAKVLGIPHPPGNPVFVLLAHAFGLLPLPLTYAARINLLAACTSAAAAGLWFLVADRILASWLVAKWPRRVASIAAALLGATAFTVWNQSVVNEKVYTLALLGVATVSWLALRWLDATATARADRLLLLIAYLLGVGYANHPAGLLPLPAFAMLLVVQRPRTLLRWRLLATAGVCACLGLTPFLFQPIRSANAPAINGGAPTACHDGPHLACTFSAETFERLMANVNREQYNGHPVAERQAPFVAQVGMWWMYFERQWLRDAYGEHVLMQQGLAILFLTLGIAGAMVHWNRDRATFWYVGTLIATLNFGLIVYLNFKYAPLQSPELGDTVAREVRDRDYFYIWGFSTWGLWVGVALAAAWERLMRRAAHRLRVVTLSHAVSWCVATPGLVVACIPLLANAHQAPRRGQTFAREWAIDLLNSVEPYGILITNGDNDSFPLWYAQEVEGVRRDVTLALAPYLGTDWYVRELLERRPDAYDAARGPALYRSGTWTRPMSAPLQLTANEADAIPAYTLLDTPQRFVHGGISAIIPPGYFTRDQFIVLRFIKDSFPARPVYFSLGNYAQSMGLGPYVVAQGLAQRLLESPAQNSATVMSYPGGHLDLTRTDALWRAYGAPGALVRQPGWIDAPSLGIPSAYAATGQLLAAGLAARGDSVRASAVMQTVTALSKAAHLQ